MLLNVVRSGSNNKFRPHGRNALMGGDPDLVPGPEDLTFRD